MLIIEKLSYAKLWNPEWSIYLKAYSADYQIGNLGIVILDDVDKKIAARIYWDTDDAMFYIKREGQNMIYVFKEELKMKRKIQLVHKTPI